VENGLGEGGALAAPMDSPWKKTTQLTELSEGSSGQPRHSLEKKKMLSQEEILFLRSKQSVNFLGVLAIQATFADPNVQYYRPKIPMVFMFKKKSNGFERQTTPPSRP
jgi:hypothetical protein